MIRHPIYLTLCLVSAGYLFMADAKGWSFWQGMVARTSSNGWGGTHSGFNHK